MEEKGSHSSLCTIQDFMNQKYQNLIVKIKKLQEQDRTNLSEDRKNLLSDIDYLLTFYEPENTLQIILITSILNKFFDVTKSKFNWDKLELFKNEYLNNNNNNNNNNNDDDDKLPEFSKIKTTTFPEDYKILLDPYIVFFCKMFNK